MPACCRPLWLSCLLACNPAALNVDAQADKDDSGGRYIGDTATNETGDSSAPIDTAPPIEYDCSALPDRPTVDAELDAPKGYHDLAFDNAGRIVGWDGRASLGRSTYDNVYDILAPGFQSVQGIDRLHDGDFVVGDDVNQSLWRVTDEGVKTLLASDIGYLYGVMVGPDGKIYVGSNLTIVRVDPATGIKETLLEFPVRDTPRAVAFSLDNSTMYISTVGRGMVYSAPLDATLTPTSPATIFANDVGGGWHDGIGIDACGNLYIPEYNTSGLYRLAPDGTTTTIFRGQSQRYGHGLEWGSALGGWRADALYMPQPYDQNTVREVVIGVPSGALVREPYTAP
jgi:hypothetical protein